MKIQLALDDLDFDTAMDLLDQVHDYIDIVEVGTPFIIEEGMRPVREIKKRFPQLEILADVKIMDAGEYESSQVFNAGAHYGTVLGVSDDITIKACVDTAEKYNTQIVVDMICVDDLKTRIKTLEMLGVKYLAVHTGVDQQQLGRTPLDDLKTMKKYSQHSVISVAGGISLDTVLDYKKSGADVVIIGSGITHADNPEETAKNIFKKVKGL